MEAMKRIDVLLLVLVGVVCLAVDGKYLDPRHGCLNVHDKYACKHLKNGDYAVCPPACEYGKFITCSNGIVSIKDCALGWFKRPGDSVKRRFTKPLVFDPYSNYCLQGSNVCPRKYDDFIERGK
ncbi:hypothetical protein BsWGS_25296 [Bradybaena similaris]